MGEQVPIRMQVPPKSRKGHRVTWNWSYVDKCPKVGAKNQTKLRASQLLPLLLFIFLNVGLIVILAGLKLYL